MRTSALISGKNSGEQLLESHLLEVHAYRVIQDIELGLHFLALIPERLRVVSTLYELADHRNHLVRACSASQAGPTLCDPMHCGPPDSSVHGLFRQEYWSGLQLPTPGDLPEAEIKLPSLVSPVLTRGFFTTRATWEVLVLNDSMSERWEKNSKF